jgi:magnesium chelatase subunit I
VELQNCFDAEKRREIVKARLAFDTDPEAFRSQFAGQQEALALKLCQARAMLPSLELDDVVHARVSELCIGAHVDGLRADLVMLRAARALAAYEEASAVNVEHVERVAESVLSHRRKEASGPSDQRATEPRQQQRSQDADDASFGYMPPEPVDITTVKNVRPLAAKKS